MVSIGILGVRGRMGRAVAQAVEEAGATLAGGVDRDGYFVGNHPDASALAEACDVLVDFSAPDALIDHLDAAVAAGTPIVIGTTGITHDHHDAIDDAAERVAVVQAFNMSLGVNVLAALVEQAARRLGPDWDIEIVEMHHRQKLDTPSGTALLLGAAANVGRGATGADELNRYDRMQDGAHAREQGGIYYASLRGGSVSGDHNVIFATEGERIELGHRAEERSIFARGAVRAAQWLADKGPGRYTMTDVLGFE